MIQLAMDEGEITLLEQRLNRAALHFCHLDPRVCP